MSSSRLEFLNSLITSVNFSARGLTATPWVEPVMILSTRSPHPPSLRPAPVAGDIGSSEIEYDANSLIAKWCDSFVERCPCRTLNILVTLATPAAIPLRTTLSVV
ncbi:hypothetical protein OGAPHI_006955 [Ogataea philodendri]|uniref:Uncharacterized protein n=1 Tax=Ogataea philodendri TaxID=1378263 RepID=A0A9P8NVU3_9ASCO|nr:uncharacterized protein OGAPHI_006955 [Ogataea philodendri]KAH3660369.1 hypothetical protein OGAPHI_006955 [Ogataea philodendri]